MGAVGLDHPHRRRRQLAHAAVDGPRRGHHRVEAHVVVQRIAVQFGVHSTGVEQRAHRGREPQPPGDSARYSGLMPEPVAGERDHARFAVGDREREHALEPLDAARAPFVKRLDDHLAVGGGEEPVARGLQFVAQLLVVVDAAVEHQRQPEVAVHHRLGAAGGQVDDRQSPMPEGDPPCATTPRNRARGTPSHTSSGSPRPRPPPARRSESRRRCRTCRAP